MASSSCSFLFLLAIGLGLAARGVDFAGVATVKTAQCLVNAGFGDFGIVRAWHSYGGFDVDAPGSVAALWQGGFKEVDVYLFPCPTKNIALQVKEMVGNLTVHGVKYHNIWLDIEEDPSTGCGWSNNKETNCATMGELAKAVNATGIPWGTYTSTYEWSTLMGESCVVPLAASHRLWYPHYERPHNPSFSDFRSFGGWTAPYMKQYDDTDGGVCMGGQADINWRP
eukprot:m.23417 g.23417  ORF g.23417 m.23417 type:complete len:225 (-) comp8499_c0_seq1:42-716(-)